MRLQQRKVASRPEPLLLAKQITEQGFSQTAKKYGVSDNAIKKWCVAYGIGKLKHEVAIWYSQHKEK